MLKSHSNPARGFICQMRKLRPQEEKRPTQVHGASHQPGFKACEWGHCPQGGIPDQCLIQGEAGLGLLSSMMGTMTSVHSPFHWRLVTPGQRRGP